MNSKRKKKIAAAAMAFTSIFGAKNSNAAPKAGSTAILENSGEQSLSQYENKTKKYDKKSQNTNNGPLVEYLSTVFFTAGFITFAAWLNNKKTDIDNTYDNKSKQHNNPGDILKRKDSKKVWENDPHGIIKFLTWYGGQDYRNGSCIVNSYLNMFLNPVIMDYIANKKNVNSKFSGQYWRSKVPILGNVWQLSKKHEFIKAELKNPRTDFDSVYFVGEMIIKSLISDAPDLIGTLGEDGTIAKAIQDNVEENMYPPLVFCNLAGQYNHSWNSKPESVLKNPDLDKASYKLPNECSYFVGGAILRCPGHTVFAHLLYDDDGTKLERVIIQDPNSSSNNNPNYYVKEMQVDDMKQLFVVNENDKETKYGEYNGYHIEKLLMIRDYKFTESKYWKNSSLDGSIVSKF